MDSRIDLTEHNDFRKSGSQVSDNELNLDTILAVTYNGESISVDMYDRIRRHEEMFGKRMSNESYNLFRQDDLHPFITSDGTYVERIKCIRCGKRTFPWQRKFCPECMTLLSCTNSLWSYHGPFDKAEMRSQKDILNLR